MPPHKDVRPGWQGAKTSPTGIAKFTPQVTSSARLKLNLRLNFKSVFFN
jgi:hypothetical protein